MKIFWNTKNFTEYKTSSEYENVSLNIKVFLWIQKDELCTKKATIVYEKQ